ncbi:alginate O-acetyltransferase AlgX-related protein [Rugamonas sp. DEMB1]|jgi:hypothetical protein|uniref:alginate O-acetyltransferase AlgX-related protein n=1 Tax=Rugamonas sp. DEMB1 TaxID=3039386 RepID=UPI00244941FD|nr:hypothetical protein [Rugamonas sp. DEMB1]WGG49130.1 hypothetical protein QC826_21320 [Rugamonas sp. DEMB1]
MTRFLFSLCAGLLAALLLTEALLRLLPVNSGVRMAATDAATPYAHHLPRQEFTYSHGWAMRNARRGTTNEAGGNNSPPPYDGAGLMLVGDSYIESFMLAYPDTVQGRLQGDLHGGVFTVAASANGLADSLQIARQLLPARRPRNAVFFVESTDMSGILDAATRGHNAFRLDGGAVSVAHSPYQESAWKPRLLHSALMRYLYYNLKFPDWVGGKMPRLGQTAAVAKPSAQQRQAALDYYFDALRALGEASGSKVSFLLDGDRVAIYADHKAGTASWQDGDRALFLAGARRHGFDVADMAPVFEQHWRARRERMDFLPMDGHWNSVAHRLAARQLLPLMRPAPRPAAGDGA